MDELEKRIAIVQAAEEFVAEYKAWCKGVREIDINAESLRPLEEWSNQIEGTLAHRRDLIREFRP